MAQSAFAKGAVCTKDQEFNGAFCSENVELRFGSSGATKGALVQSAQWNCQRTVSMIYEIGSPAVYYVGNRRQGTAQFTRIVSGSGVFTKLVEDYGDVCKPQNLVIDASQKAACGGVQPGGVEYTLVSATLNSVGGSVTANDVVITENLGFMFLDLYYKKK